MATVSFPTNTVPLGQAGTGEAFILGSGMAPLNLLQRQDAIGARARQQAAALKTREQAQDFSAFLNNSNLKADGYLPFKPQIEQLNTQTRQQLNAVAHDDTLDRYQKLNRYKELVDKNNSVVDTTNEIKERLDKVRQSAADPRYSKQAIAKALENTYKDEQGNIVPIDKFQPDRVTSVLEDARNYDPTQVVTKWVKDTLAADQNTVGKAARPGGYGSKASYQSNYFQSNADGTGPLLDPKTSLPIPRTDRPEVLLAAEGDPFLKGLLDLRQGEYQKQLDGVMQKMQNYEPLTDAERLLVGQEEKQPKTRADILNELLVPHAFQRTSNVTTYSRPIQPRASAGSNTQTVVAGNSVTAANIGVKSVAGNSGFVSAATLNQPYEEKKGVRKEITMRQPRFSNVTVTVPGQGTKHYANLQEGQDVILGRPHLFLTSKTGVAYFPKDPAIANDPERSRQWIVQQLSSADAKQKGLHLSWHIEANPSKGQNGLGDSNVETADIDASYRQGGSAGGPGASVASLYPGSRSTPSGTETRDKGDKIYSRKNATYYVLYEGGNRQLIDGRTPGYRAQQAQMDAELSRLTSQVKRPKANPLGFGAPAAKTSTPAATKYKTVGKNNALGF